MKAEADAKRYEMKGDYIREKSREYYRKKKVELSEAAALKSKKKKAAYDSKRYKCKRDELNSKAKERYHKKAKPEKVYYERTMAIDGVPRRNKAANVPIFIRDPRHLTGQIDIMEFCVDFNKSGKNKRIRRSIFHDTRESVLLEIANVVRNHLSSSFPNPILCEFMLYQVLHPEPGSIHATKDTPGKHGVNVTASNMMIPHFSKAWFKSMGFTLNDHRCLHSHIHFRLKHLYGICGHSIDQHCVELIVEHASKLETLNSQISTSLQSLLSKELMALQNYFSLCVNDYDALTEGFDDVATRLMVSSILMFVFLTENKSSILRCGFQKLHYLYVLEESRQRLQDFGLYCWSIGKFVLEDWCFSYLDSSSNSETFLKPHEFEHYDPHSNGYYYSIGPTSHWKITKSKFKNAGKTIVFRDNVLSFRLNRPYWWS